MVMVEIKVRRALNRVEENIDYIREHIENYKEYRLHIIEDVNDEGTIELLGVENLSELKFEVKHSEVVVELEDFLRDHNLTYDILVEDNVLLCIIYKLD